MLATWVNVGTILLGAVLGTFMGNKIPDRVRKVLTLGIGLCVLLIGAQSALQTGSVILMILSVVLGGSLGALLQIENRLNRMGEKLQKQFSGGGKIGEGFVNATLIFCVGAMAVTGALDAGLRGNYDTLLAKSVLDGVTAMVLSSTLGIGVAFSAVSVLLYQGSITLLSSWAAPFLSDPRLIGEMTAAGGLLIMGIGLNMLGTKEHIPVGDLLPAVLMPLFLIFIL